MRTYSTDVFGNTISKGNVVYVVSTPRKIRRFLNELEAKQCEFAFTQEHTPCRIERRVWA